MKTSFNKTLWFNISAIVMAGTFLLQANAFAGPIDAGNTEMDKLRQMGHKMEKLSSKAANSLRSGPMRTESLRPRTGNLAPKMGNSLRPMRAESLRSGMGNLRSKIGDTLRPMRAESLRSGMGNLRPKIGDFLRKPKVSNLIIRRKR